MSSLKKRVISAVVALILLGVVLYINGVAIQLSILVLSVFAVKEFVSAYRNIGKNPSLVIGIAMIVLFLSVVRVGMGLAGESKYYLILLSASAFCMIFFVTMFVDFVKSKSSINMMINLFSLLYIGFPMAMIMVIANNDMSRLFLIFIIAFASDTSAYFSGSLLGKNKLAPEISPNKTKEGALGAVVGTTLVLVIAKYFYYTDMSYLAVIIYGVIGSALAQLGDLTASVIKRHAKIKDFGNVMPGHGGIIDRLDSIFFVTPLVFFLLMLEISKMVNF